MDQLDRQIIAQLQANGRRSNVEIARDLGISEGTVRKRIERLVSEGLVQLTAVVDPAHTGCSVRALIFLNVRLPLAEGVTAILREMPEVMSVYQVAGEYDLIMEAVFSSDTALHDFLAYRVARIEGVVSSKTAHVLSIPKRGYLWAPPPADTPEVLIVDDDPDFVEATRLVLEAHGYRIRAAGNGQAAMRALIAAPPDLIIMDIMMDGILDGWDASWRIHSSAGFRHIPILVVSSITSTEYLRMLPTDDDNLIDGFFSKPVAPDRLASEVARLLRRAGV